MRTPVGKYKAKIIEYGISEGQQGKSDMAVIKFSFFVGDEEQVLSWRGALTPRAMKFTLKTLYVCGFQGYDISRLTEEGALDLEPEYQVTVIHENGQDGKTYTKIQWVNAPLGGKLKNMLDPAKAKQKYKNLQGTVAQFCKENGIKTEAAPSGPTTTPEDAPF